MEDAEEIGVSHSGVAKPGGGFSDVLENGGV